jgi:hypothetical protein
VALCPHVAPFADNQFDCCDLLQRSGIHHGTAEIASSPFSIERGPVPGDELTTARRARPAGRTYPRVAPGPSKEPNHARGDLRKWLRRAVWTAQSAPSRCDCHALSELTYGHVGGFRRGDFLTSNQKTSWRRGRDSNPRYGYPYAAFRVRCFQPLSHLSLRRRAGAKAPTVQLFSEASAPKQGCGVTTRYPRCRRPARACPSGRSPPAGSARAPRAAGSRSRASPSWRPAARTLVSPRCL